MKSFRLNLIFRIFLLCASILLEVYVYYNTEFTATIGILFLIIIYQIFSLIRFIDTTNKELARFILSIKYSDFSQTFTGMPNDKSFDSLREAFNEVINKFKSTRSEKEENYRYLQTVMQHIGVGLISFDKEGKVELLNNAAKKILNIPYLNNVKSLDKITKGISDTFLTLNSGDKKTIKIIDSDEIVQLILYATEFKMRNTNYTLVSIQNIQTELEEKEMEAWQKLIRVLTHEIMNSITPISSLASTINLMINNHTEGDYVFSEEKLKDITDAVNTIQKRSEGLIHFVDNYRNLTRIPKPNFQIFPIKELFDRVEKLMKQKLLDQNIKFDCKVFPETLSLTADSEMIEQVLINLIINAMNALSGRGNPEINLSARTNERGKIIIKVTDNGFGIPEDVQEKIFIPFYTTKKDGSGIGLSLSRQIIRAHGGNIRVSSIPNKETTFTLRF
ncbi:MAG: GHKL domain-containing protein [Bacteroidetes bacterium]|nr:GHKL domain-containing protein [Bacteroidota bacterium]